jgi:hypothetical protein
MRRWPLHDVDGPAGADILAVDFSVEALRKLARRLRSGVAPTSFEVAPLREAADLIGHVGLVQADASEFHAAPCSFDAGLSASPLDSRDERMRMFCAVAASLKDDGHYVAGVEHDDLLRRLLGLPVARRYTLGGIFIEHFDINTLQREIAPYFYRLRFQFCLPRVPLAKRLPLKVAIFLSWAAVRLPLLRQLGQILLVRAECPIRPHPEDHLRPWHFPAVYRWFKRWTGRRFPPTAKDLKEDHAAPQ